MTELSHRDIWERLAALEVRLDERFAAVSKEIANLQASLADTSAKSAAQRERIFQRLESLERRAAVIDAAGKAETEAADRWRGRVYVALRYIIPPGASAGIVVWLAERGVI